MTKKLIILIVFCVNYYTNAFCYDDKITHPSITEKAINNSGLGLYIKNSLGLNDGIDTKVLSNSNDTVKVLLKTGSTEEDSPSCRAASHFLNPLKDWDTAGLSDTNETLFGFGLNTYCFGSAPFSSRFSIHKYSDVTWATRYTSPTEQGGETGNDMDWTAARTYYRLALTATDQNTRETYFAKTFQTLGQVMHLLQDMAVPAHVRNDFTAHLGFQKAGLSSPTTWFGNTYEWYVKNHSELFGPALVGTEVVTPPNSLLTAFWDANNDQGLAEYTNANFFSESTIFAELKDSADIHYFPRPAKADTNAAEKEAQAMAMEVTAEDGIQDRTIYVTKNNGDYKMATYSFSRKWVEHKIIDDGVTPYEVTGYVSSWEYNLDDEVYKDYAQELLPRAVGYSAALINYFFRGQMETTALERLDVDDNVTELLVNVKNTTPDEMMDKGYFTLAYRYKLNGSDQYIYGTKGFIPSGELSSGSSLQLDFAFAETNPSDPSQTTDSPIPADATDKQYTLVYSGTLGAETGAVVGKVVKVVPDAIAITAPEHFVYALADDGLPNKSFAKLRMRLRDNAPTVAMTGGSVIATAKYKVHLTHTDDLANEPPDGFERAYDFTTVASLPVEIALDATSTKEVEFDFSANPIPFGITDLSLEVVYRKDDAPIAIGTKDLNEPQYVGVWNSHDRFLIDLDLNTSDSVHDWQLLTQDEIMDDPALVRWLDTDGGGLIDEIIDPVDVDIDVAFVGAPEEVLPENYHASYSHIPAGRFGRLAFIADQSPVFALFHDRYTSSLPDSSAPDDYLSFDGIGRYFFPGVTNQQAGETYYYTPIYLFRGVKNHFSYISVGVFPKPANRTEEGMAIKEADWPEPASPAPVPAATIKP